MFSVSVSPISVGSNVFFTFALVFISALVLLLLRRFLTLRATPAYLILPIFLALALPASVVLLVPIDLASSSRNGSGPKAIWLPDRMVLVCWRIAYWLIFVLTWVILPLLGEYVDSGYREPRARIIYSLRQNARYQLIVLCCATVGLIYISIQIKFDFTSIKGLVMALAYVWGLVLAIYLMGHGLVSIPRNLFRNANVSGRLRRIQAHAPKVHDRLMDAVNELESLESQVNQLQQRKTGTARDFQEWIEELGEGAGATDVRAPILESPDTTSTVPSVITERYLADLTRRLQRARHMKARFVDEWDRLVQTAADLQTIINSAASKKLDFGSSARRSSFLPRVKLLTPYMRYQVYSNVIPTVRLIFGAVFAGASVCIIWSELIKSVAPQISIISLTIVPNWKDPKPVGFGGQVTASAWLLYMCSAALVGVNDAKVWGNRALVRRNTYGESACWYASLVARLTVPIAYNFLTFLPKDFRQNTTFYEFLGKLINLTRLGKGFDFIFPMFILLPVCGTFFNWYGRIKNIFGFALAEDEELHDVENNPSGYGLGGWREGRDLIDRELNGFGSLAVSSRGTRSTWASDLSPGGSRGSSSSRLRVPQSESSEPARRTVAAPTVIEGEEEDENFFQSFAHRVRNTFETANPPQWLQRDQLRLPRWMSGDNTTTEEGGVNRLFGGRAVPGRLRLG
ncbi:LMBR1-like membrane protein [Penicillium riverlandense]|uniref:LMBR1-like membrane protein n=1 Tax=Penicillium riverlandense TaxID=1903569 RepID=UPI002548C5E7|nr:LMBR1-like membrane protein [Penicillium riverlandense]KAJ5818661.1 LMBR1-like membrane protein [Penicillium riverlandense]